jgi:hypothetical protein
VWVPENYTKEVPVTSYRRVTEEVPYTYTVRKTRMEPQTRTVKVCKYVPVEKTRTVKVCLYDTQEQSRMVNVTRCVPVYGLLGDLYGHRQPEVDTLKCAR